ncbi:NUDIX hydrolase [Streptomyces sp. NPDC054949]
MSTSSPQGKSEAPHSVSVAGAVPREDGRLLAIRRADSGTWELPGGVLELSESPEVYAVRLPDALDGAGPHVRNHDGRRPTGTSV